MVDKKDLRRRSSWHGGFRNRARLQQGGYNNLMIRTRQKLDLLDQRAVYDFLQAEKPDHIFWLPPRSAASMPTIPTVPTSSTRT